MADRRRIIVDEEPTVAGDPSTATPPAAPTMPAAPEPSGVFAKPSKEYEAALGETLQDESSRTRIRTGEQAALLLTLPSYIGAVVKYKVDAGTSKALATIKQQEFMYDNIITDRTGEVGHTELMKNIYDSEYLEYFLRNLSTDAVNFLVPQVKLYKVFYKDNYEDYYSWRIPFDDAAVRPPSPVSNNSSEYLYSGSTSNIDRILAGEQDRLDGVGIKNFSFRYIGVNPAEVNSNIEAEMEIFFENIEDLIKRIKFTHKDSRFIGGKPDAGKEYDFAYADLVIPSNKIGHERDDVPFETSNVYRIKAVCTYAQPDEEFIKNWLEQDILKQYFAGDADEQAKFLGYQKDIREKLITAIRSTRVVLWLTAWTHDISFNENGSITLKIKYIAAVDQTLNEVNAFAFTAVYEEARRKIDEYKNLLLQSSKSLSEAEQCKYGKRKEEPESEKERKKAAKMEMENRLDQERVVLWSDIYRQILNLNSKNVPGGDIFNLNVPAALAGLVPLKIGAKRSNLLPATYATKLRLHALFGKFGEPSITRVREFDAKDLKELTVLSNVQVKGTSGITTTLLEEIGDWITGATAGDFGLLARLNERYAKPDTSLAFIAEPDPPPLVDSLLDGGVDGIEPEEELTVAEQIEKKVDEAEPEVIEKALGDTILDARINIKFIFLGDLIDIFAKSIKQIKNPYDRPRIILGNFFLHLPDNFSAGSKFEKADDVHSINVEYTKHLINLADIPISLKALQRFFVDRVIKPNRDTYSLLELINDLMNHLILPCLSPAVMGRNKAFTNYIRLSRFGFSLPLAKADTDLFSTKKISDDIGCLLSYQGEKKVLTSSSFNTKVNSFAIKDTLKSVSKKNDDEFVRATAQYVYISCFSQTPNFLLKNKGDYFADRDTGVLHFRVGQDNGIVKSMNFSKTQNQYQKEAVASRAGNKNAGVIKDVYDVEIKLFGNTLFKPGDFIYIEPLYLSSSAAVRIQNSIGLGGYYQVVESNTVINEGSIETTLKTVLFAHLVEGNMQEVSAPVGECT